MLKQIKILTHLVKINLFYICLYCVKSGFLDLCLSISWSIFRGLNILNLIKSWQNFLIHANQYLSSRMDWIQKSGYSQVQLEYKVLQKYKPPSITTWWLPLGMKPPCLNRAIDQNAKLAGLKNRPQTAKPINLSCVIFSHFLNKQIADTQKRYKS